MSAASLAVICFWLGGGSMLGIWLWLEERWVIALVVCVVSTVAAMCLSYNADPGVGS